MLIGKRHLVELASYILAHLVVNAQGVDALVAKFYGVVLYGWVVQITAIEEFVLIVEEHAILGVYLVGKLQAPLSIARVVPLAEPHLKFILGI